MPEIEAGPLEGAAYFRYGGGRASEGKPLSASIKEAIGAGSGAVWPGVPAFQPSFD